MAVIQKNYLRDLGSERVNQPELSNFSWKLLVNKVVNYGIFFIFFLISPFFIENFI